MESRRITLLRRGYYSGRLDFVNRTSLSALREQHILYTIEEEQIIEIAKVRALMDAAIAAGINKAEGYRYAFESYDSYKAAVLPWVKNKNTADVATPTSFTKIKEFHEKNKIAFNKLKEKRQNDEKTDLETDHINPIPKLP